MVCWGIWTEKGCQDGKDSKGSLWICLLYCYDLSMLQCITNVYLHYCFLKKIFLLQLCPSKDIEIASSSRSLYSDVSWTNDAMHYFTTCVCMFSLFPKEWIIWVNIHWNWFCLNNWHSKVQWCVFVPIPLYCAHSKPKALESIISVYFWIMHLLIQIIYLCIVFLTIIVFYPCFYCYSLAFATQLNQK